MEKIVEQGILYDFYGPLLTKHQQEVYEALVYEDLSLSEIAEGFGISRQGVHDLIKRCDKILADYEAKLNLVARFSENKNKLQDIKNMVNQTDISDKNMLHAINQNIDEIIDIL